MLSFATLCINPGKSMLETKFKSFILLLLMAVLLPIVFVPVNAAETDGGTQDVEVVLLFDVSGSMNQSDPVSASDTRLSIEAAHQFVFNYPTEANMYITVVPYNSNIYTDFDKVNVATPDGLKNYVSKMEDILENGLDGFTCWANQTDIGGALERAKEILEKSAIERKTVVLFTDGKIELPNVDAINESKNKAEANSKALKDAGIPIYSIGLDVNNGVDRDLLYSISGEENTNIVKSAADLIGIFNEVYTFLFPNSRLDDNVEEFEIAPEKTSERTVRIYGQAVKEANISISSLARLNTIRVETPSGVKVADIDLRSPENAVINSDYCIINYSSRGCSATIKLISPMDGDWKVFVSGEKSTVITRKIYLFDLLLKDSIPDENVYIGEALKYNASIYNSESSEHLTSSGLYSAEDGASAIVEIKRVGSDSSSLYNGTLNRSKDGFDFNVGFDAPGEYTITTILTHSQFQVKSVKTVKVVGPMLALDVIDAHASSFKSMLYLKDPVSGRAISAPEYLSGGKIAISVTSEGETVDTINVDISSLTTDGYTFEYTPSKAGDWTFTAAIDSSYGSIESESLTITAHPSKISMEKNLAKKLSKTSLSGSFSETISLDGAFSDSDGDKLKYTVRVSDDSPITAEIDDTLLKICADDFGECVVTILVSDGRGASYEFEMEVSFKSILPMIIALAVSAVVFIIAAVVAIIIIKKKSIISVAFRVKLEIQDEESYNESTAVYSVVRLTSRKRSRPKMTLSEILTINGFATRDEESKMSEDNERRIISTHCANVTMSGVPFKRAIKIVYKDTSRKNVKPRTYKFTNPNVVIRTSEPGCTITIGNSHAEF